MIRTVRQHERWYPRDKRMSWCCQEACVDVVEAFVKWVHAFCEVWCGQNVCLRASVLQCSQACAEEFPTHRGFTPTLVCRLVTSDKKAAARVEAVNTPERPGVLCFRKKAAIRATSLISVFHAHGT